MTEMLSVVIDVLCGIMTKDEVNRYVRFIRTEMRLREEEARRQMVKAARPAKKHGRKCASLPRRDIDEVDPIVKVIFRGYGMNTKFGEACGRHCRVTHTKNISQGRKSKINK